MSEEVVVHLSGRIDAANSKNIQEFLAEKLSTNCRSLTLDLQEVTSIDSSGLGILVTTFKQLKERGGHLNLSHVSPGILAILEQTHLDKVFLIEGRSAAERERQEEEEALKAAPPAVPIAPKVTGRIEPGLSFPRYQYLYIGLGLSLALLVGTQLYFYRRITDDELRPYLKSNAALVRAVLTDLHRSAQKYPGSAQELQQLLQEKALNLKNVYSKTPLQIFPGKQGGQPGDLLYDTSIRGYELRVVGKDGLPLREENGAEFILTERQKA